MTGVLAKTYLRQVARQSGWRKEHLMVPNSCAGSAARSTAYPDENLHTCAGPAEECMAWNPGGEQLCCSGICQCFPQIEAFRVAV